MAGAVPPSAPAPTPFDRTLAREGFRQLGVGSYLGLVGQILIWGSAIALWVVGSLFSSIPRSTSVAYGAQGISVSAGAIFAFNFALVAGTLFALGSVVLWTRGLRNVAKAALSLKVETEASLATIGGIGLGLFALGWMIWLGSFVPPGSPATGDPLDYVPVLALNLAVVVDLLLVLGGLLAFLGMLGIALGSSKVGVTYEEGLLELGGALALLPVLSILGSLLSLVGLAGGKRKLDRGWTPPPPPPPPSYQTVFYSVGYPTGVPVAAPVRQDSWDGLAAVLIVVVILLWVFIVPIAVLSNTTKGPGSTPIVGGNSSAPAASSGPTSPLLPVLLLAFGATAVLVPLAVVRNRRKRQRASSPAVPPTPPPPPQTPPPPSDDDPLDHLV
ncbi:MAG: DUF973 family protein [Thermoplasmata archaeon]|nr:DUF973 family protein [Thermoplasmata archaeon]